MRGPLLERKQDLLVAGIDLLRDAVRRVKRRYTFEIVAWVVLPDHLHCMELARPAGDTADPTRWRLIKLPFAKDLPILLVRDTQLAMLAFAAP